jgi:hypothetical protein
VTDRQDGDVFSLDFLINKTFICWHGVPGVSSNLRYYEDKRQKKGMERGIWGLRANGSSNAFTGMEDSPLWLADSRAANGMIRASEGRLFLVNLEMLR